MDEIRQIVEEEVNKQTEMLKKEVESLKKEMSEVKQENQNLRGALSKLENELDEVEQYNRKSSLILMGGGIDEGKKDETPKETRELAKQVISDKLNVKLHGSIVACHRLRNRKWILVKFQDHDDREAVYRSKFKQGGDWKDRVAIHENLTERRARTVKLHGEMQKADKVLNFYTRNGRIMARSASDKQYSEIKYWFSEKNIMDELSRAPVRNTNPHHPQTTNTQFTRSQTLQNLTSGHVARQAANLEDYLVENVRKTRQATKHKNGGKNAAGSTDAEWFWLY